MADASVFDLTQETVMTAAARIPLQETSGATRATSATFALLGGLETETSRDTNANHADFNGVVGQLHCVDMSGASLTSEVVMTLPATAAVGERVGVYITAGSSTDGEELSVRTPASDTINGTDYSAADWSRLFITGEVVVFRCIVANTDWIVEHDGRIPAICLAYDDTGLAVSTTGATPSFSAINDNGSMLDTTNDWVKLRRKSSVEIRTWWLTGATIDDGNYSEAVIQVDAAGTPVNTAQQRATASAGNMRLGMDIGIFGNYLDGETFDMYTAVQNAGGNYTSGSTATNQLTIKFYVAEVGW